MNRAQKERLAQFVGITGADSGVAQRCLEAAGWSVEAGIEVFYSSGMHLQASRSGGSRLDRCAPQPCGTQQLPLQRRMLPLQLGGQSLRSAVQAILHVPTCPASQPCLIYSHPALAPAAARPAGMQFRGCSSGTERQTRMRR